MFRPAPKGPYTADQTIAKLTYIMRGLPSESEQAGRLAKLIRRLQTLQSTGTAAAA
jgi:hypothetical protein